MGRGRFVIMVLALLLATGGMVSAAAYSYRTGRPRDLTYTPSDGAFSRIRLNGQAGQLEQAVEPGAGFLSSGYAGAVALRHQPWDFPVDNDLWVADARAGGDRLRVLWRVGKHDVSLLGVITGTDGLAFSPTLPVSDGTEDAARTDQVSGEMIVGTGEAPFDATTRVEGRGGCLDWSARVTSRTPSADSTISFRSCRTTGLQRLTYQRSGRSVVTLSTVARRPAADRFTGRLTSPPINPDDLAHWQPGKVSLALADGTGSAGVDPLNDVSPAIMPGGRFAVAGVDHSVFAFRTRGKVARVAWVAHPGGRISRLLDVGELLIVITDQRKVIAYDSDGRRVWQQQTADLVADATVAGDRLILAVYGASIMALDLRSGTRLWQTAAESVTTTMLAGDNRFVVYGDSNWTSHTLSVRDGSEVADATGDSLSGVGLVDGDRLALRNRYLYRQNLTGTAYVLAVDAGEGLQLHVAGQLGAITGSTGVALIDLGTGKQVGKTPPAIGAVDGPGGILVADSKQTTVYTAAGPSRASWPISLADRTAVEDLGLGSWGAVILNGDNAVVIR